MIYFTASWNFHHITGQRRGRFDKDEWFWKRRIFRETWPIVVVTLADADDLCLSAVRTSIKSSHFSAFVSEVFHILCGGVYAYESMEEWAYMVQRVQPKPPFRHVGKLPGKIPAHCLPLDTALKTGPSDYSHTLNKIMTKIALVTGASSGIGRASAIALSKAGWTLVLSGRREDALRETLSLLNGVGSYVVGDLADPAAVKALFRHVESKHGKLQRLKV